MSSKEEKIYNVFDLLKKIEKLENKNKKLKELLKSKETANQVLSKVGGDLSNSITSKNKLLDHYEQTLRSCESACIYHQERAEKAYEIIGRMKVEKELL